MTSRQEAINQLFELTTNRKLDGGVANINYDALHILTGRGLEWWEQATYRQHKSAIYLMNANVKYYFGLRDDYRLWVCPACMTKLVNDYRNN